jgi:hypothetical protein
MKQSVTLHFPSLQHLYGFNKEVSPNSFEVSIRALLLTCDCTKDHIELVTTKYGSKIIKLQKRKTERLI